MLNKEYIKNKNSLYEQLEKNGYKINYDQQNKKTIIYKINANGFTEIVGVENQDKNNAFTIITTTNKTMQNKIIYFYQLFINDKKYTFEYNTKKSDFDIYENYKKTLTNDLDF